MKKERSSGAIIFIRDKPIKYLLVQYGNGYWEFVRGNIEENETEKETAIREAKEETGISDLNFIESFKEKISFFYKMNNELINKEIIFFLAETKIEKIKLSFEHKDYKWLEIEDALKLIKFKNSREVLIKADKFLKSPRLTDF